jgi:hypothetical protein
MDIRDLLGPKSRSDFEEVLKRLMECSESLAPRAPGAHEQGNNLSHWQFPMSTSREDDDND